MIKSVKIEFDPANYEHLMVYKDFMMNSRWNTVCPFKLEWPYESIPSMIHHKFMSKYIDFVMNSIQNENATL